jgi:hypothetical protein
MVGSPVATAFIMRSGSGLSAEDPCNTCNRRNLRINSLPAVAIGYGCNYVVGNPFATSTPQCFSGDRSAVRVLGASAYGAQYIIASRGTLDLIEERDTDPRIWTAERDTEMWHSLQNG